MYKTTILMACATVDTAVSSMPPADASDDEIQEKTRVVVIEFSRSDEHDARLEKVGDWYIDGPPDGVMILRESDSQSLSF